MNSVRCHGFMQLKEMNRVQYLISVSTMFLKLIFTPLPPKEKKETTPNDHMAD